MPVEHTAAHISASYDKNTSNNSENVVGKLSGGGGGEGASSVCGPRKGDGEWGGGRGPFEMKNTFRRLYITGVVVEANDGDLYVTEGKAEKKRR